MATLARYRYGPTCRQQFNVQHLANCCRSGAVPLRSSRRTALFAALTSELATLAAEILPAPTVLALPVTLSCNL